MDDLTGKLIQLKPGKGYVILDTPDKLLTIWSSDIVFILNFDIDDSRADRDDIVFMRFIWHGEILTTGLNKQVFEDHFRVIS